MLTRRDFYGAICVLGATGHPFSVHAQAGNGGIAVRIRIDDSVRGSIPAVILRTLTIEPDHSDVANELINLSPPTRAVPVILIIAGVLAIPVLLEITIELTRQTYYGGVIIDARTQPPLVSNNPKIPANMVFVVGVDGKTYQYTSTELSGDLLRTILGSK
jgi:hypothetical protein